MDDVAGIRTVGESEEVTLNEQLPSTTRDDQTGYLVMVRMLPSERVSRGDIGISRLYESGTAKLCVGPMR